MFPLLIKGTTKVRHNQQQAYTNEKCW